MIWTGVDDSILYDDNHNADRAFKSLIKEYDVNKKVLYHALLYTKWRPIVGLKRNQKNNVNMNGRVYYILPTDIFCHEITKYDHKKYEYY